MDPNADGWKTFWIIVAVFVAVVVIMAWSFARAADARAISGPATVIDGDTLIVAANRIRLHGIDAPEMRQPCGLDGRYLACGAAARIELARMIADLTVTCRQTAVDKYKRIVATCSTRIYPDIGEAMVRDGWAVAYRKYSEKYVPAEAEARAARRGIWASEFQMPWEWRYAR